MTISRAQMRTQMKGNPMNNSARKPATKKSMYDLSKKGAKDFDKADRNKMKNYGDIPDPRPRSRVVIPDTLDTIKSMKNSTKKMLVGGALGAAMEGDIKGAIPGLVGVMIRRNADRKAAKADKPMSRADEVAAGMPITQMKSGGKVGRGDGCCMKGKTKGGMR